MKSLVWETQKFTPKRLWIESVFEYICVSFGENPITIVLYDCVLYSHLYFYLIVKKCLSCVVR